MRPMLRPFIDTKHYVHQIDWPVLQSYIPPSWCSCEEEDGDRQMLIQPRDLVNQLRRDREEPVEDRVDLVVDVVEVNAAVVDNVVERNDLVVDKDCPLHGRCDECERKNPDCDCEFFYEEHFCLTCGHVLWMCECCHILEIRDMLYEFD